MRPITFGFEGIGPFRGWTDGSYCGGFNNVWVAPEEHVRVIAAFRARRDEDLPLFEVLQPNGDGLISYAGGFAATPWRE